MDDPQFEPRLLARLLPFAWSAAPASPTRARPDRPIRFTPSRVEPIAPPPRVTRPPAERPSAPARLARLGIWLLLALGWVIFATWWAIVLRRERIAALAYAAGVLAAIVVTAIVVMALWTRHNIRLAHRGKRGRSSLYIPMCWEHDALGRPLELPACPLAQTATEVRIVLRDGVKAYVVASEVQP